MKIGVIGTINRDSIRLADGTRKEGWGGILYNLVALSSLVGNFDGIYPVCNIGKNHHKEVINILKEFPGIRTDHVRKVPQRNNHCHLTYLDNENKREILEGGVPPLKFSEVRYLEDCDFVLLNYISGRDIYLQSLQKFRRHYDGKLYIDIHSLTLGKRKNGARFIRKPPSWRDVFVRADFIQMNRLELAVIARGVNSEQEVGDRIESDLEEIARPAVKNNVNFESKYFIITDGARGCHIFHITNGRWSSRYVKSASKSAANSYPGSALNATGCGDCFAAGFVAGLAKNIDPYDCAILANKAGHSRIVNLDNIYSILDKSVEESKDHISRQK
ncbi:MAG: hypothetical protein CVT49_15455 [candidate division Zixibacteria bacterium HGW-Zixibacteria-1]|nr:MAG: hypothetical protein CVT49_15455 [candidate division Zixibacteria bacterium HGW-Zixibacteria-1]